MRNFLEHRPPNDCPGRVEKPIPGSGTSSGGCRITEQNVHGGFIRVLRSNQREVNRTDAWLMNQVWGAFLPEKPE